MNVGMISDLSKDVRGKFEACKLFQKVKDIDLDKIDFREYDKSIFKDQHNSVKEDSEKSTERDMMQDRAEIETEKSVDKSKKRELTQEEKDRIKEEKGWSDEIIDAISCVEEYEIYDKAGLVEAEIGGRKCLIRTDIDMEQKDERGRTNKERMKKGLAPIDKNGETIELHHIGQKQDSPLAELTTSEHRGKGNDVILHDKTKESEVDRAEFKKEKEQHWKDRAPEQMEGQDA